MFTRNWQMQDDVASLNNYLFLVCMTVVFLLWNHLLALMADHMVVLHFMELY